MSNILFEVNHDSAQWVAPQELFNLDSQTFTKDLRHLPSSIQKIFAEISSTEQQNEIIVLDSDMEDQQILLPQNEHGVQPPQEGEKVFKCIKCDKVYTCKGNLTRHIKFECGKAPQFQCPYCPFKTKHKCTFIMAGTIPRSDMIISSSISSDVDGSRSINSDNIGSTLQHADFGFNQRIKVKNVQCSKCGKWYSTMMETYVWVNPQEELELRTVSMEHGRGLSDTQQQKISRENNSQRVNFNNEQNNSNLTKAIFLASLCHKGRGGKGTVQCSQCGKWYSNNSNLLRHLKFECGKEPQFPCPHCLIMMRITYSLEQRIFIYDCYVKKNVYFKPFRTRNVIDKKPTRVKRVLTELDEVVYFLHHSPSKTLTLITTTDCRQPTRVKRVFTEEKLDNVDYFLQNSPSISHRRFSESTGIFKMSACKATKLLKFKKFPKTCIVYNEWISTEAQMLSQPMKAGSFVQVAQMSGFSSQFSNQDPLTPVRYLPNSGSFKCERCGNCYTYKKNLSRHVKLECGKEPQFQCPFCPKKTKHKNHMLRHVRSQHLAKM
ncbi:hypothetical protein C0J52_13322 [Blattella germanica]|nr:hypothetical protein C0J52_13322 [Blattella germanica]